MLKCFLHVSAEEQRERFAERLSDPTKRWKHNPKDEQTSRRFDAYNAAYEEALTATSTQAAPWYVIPADRNWVRNLAVATVLVECLASARSTFPGGAALDGVVDAERPPDERPLRESCASSRRLRARRRSRPRETR